MTEASVRYILQNFSMYFHQHGIIQYCLVWLSWQILELLRLLLNSAEYLLDRVYSIHSFVFSDQVLSYIGSMRPLLWILFAFSLTMLGLTLLMQEGERPKIFQNLMISLLVLTALPLLVQQISTVTFTAAQWAREEDSLKQAVSAGTGGVSTADAIILMNTTDLVWCADRGFEDLIPGSTQQVLAEEDRRENVSRPWNDLRSLNGFDPTQVIWSHDGSRSYAKYQDLFQKRLAWETENGKTELKLESIEDSWWGFLIQNYYQYHVDWLPCALTLFFTTLAVFFASYKVARLIWELAVHQMLAVLFAAGDLTSGRKLRAVLRSMGAIFLTIYLVSVLLEFFLMGVQFLQAQPLNGLVRSLFIVFFALAAIDGPNIIEKILGVDAGLRSGFHTAFAAFHGSLALQRTASGMIRSARHMTAGVRRHVSGREDLGRGKGPGPAAGGPRGSVYTETTASHRESHTRAADEAPVRAAGHTVSRDTAEGTRQRETAFNVPGPGGPGQTVRRGPAHGAPEERSGPGRGAEEGDRAAVYGQAPDREQKRAPRHRAGQARTGAAEYPASGTPDRRHAYRDPVQAESRSRDRGSAGPDPAVGQSSLYREMEERPARQRQAVDVPPGQDGRQPGRHRIQRARHMRRNAGPGTKGNRGENKRNLH